MKNIVSCSLIYESSDVVFGSVNWSIKSTVRIRKIFSSESVVKGICSINWVDYGKNNSDFDTLKFILLVDNGENWSSCTWGNTESDTINL